MPSVVLVTGAGRYLGRRLVAELAADPSVRRVIGVDSVPAPAELHRSGGREPVEYLRADIGNPLIAGVLSSARVDTVVHLAALIPAPSSGPPDPRVTAAMQLLTACQRTTALRRFVLASTTAVYGSSARNPAAFSEQARAPRTGVGAARAAVEVESHVRGLARRRPDVTVSVLRFAAPLGPGVDTGLARYLALPVVPTVLGYDPRLQVVHEDDAVAVLARTAVAGRAGTVNVAGPGAVPLSQVLRWGGRLRVPVSRRAVRAVLREVVELADEDERLLMYGRVVSTAALGQELGYRCRYSTATAVQEFLSGLPRLPRTGVAVLSAVEAALRARAPGVPAAAR